MFDFVSLAVPPHVYVGVCVAGLTLFSVLDPCVFGQVFLQLLSVRSVKEQCLRKPEL